MCFVNNLKLLANGINPETGEVIDDKSLVHKPEVIRILFALSEELSEQEGTKAKKSKITPEERRKKNIEEGRPARSHFPWEATEQENLVREFSKNQDVRYLSSLFERSVLAIAAQLRRLNLISDNDFKKYRH